jgi:hypothetical protein
LASDRERYPHAIDPERVTETNLAESIRFPPSQKICTHRESTPMETMGTGPESTLVTHGEAALAGEPRSGSRRGAPVSLRKASRRSPAHSKPID